MGRMMVEATRLFLSASGGSSLPSDTVVSPSYNTGTVGTLFTDGLTDEFDRILITVDEVRLLLKPTVKLLRSVPSAESHRWVSKGTFHAA